MTRGYSPKSNFPRQALKNWRKEPFKGFFGGSLMDPSSFQHVTDSHLVPDVFPHQNHQGYALQYDRLLIPTSLSLRYDDWDCSKQTAYQRKKPKY